MSSETSHIQFSRHIWQAVGEQAKRCLVSRDFCPDQSKIDNLRCVHFEEEIESCYGRQLWYFEAMGVDSEQKRHRLYGALEFSVQYGLLEACQAALFEDPDNRQRFLNAATQPIRSRIWEHASTRFWVRMVIVGVLSITAFGVLQVALHLTRKAKQEPRTASAISSPLSPSASKETAAKEAASKEAASKETAEPLSNAAITPPSEDK